MEKTEEKRVFRRGLRRDTALLIGLFLAVIFASWIARLINLQAALIGAAVGLGLAGLLYMVRRVISAREWRETTGIDRAISPALQSKLSIVRALRQPALILVAGVIKARNSGAADVFGLPKGELNLPIVCLQDPALLSAIDRVLAGEGYASCEVQPTGRHDEYWQVDITALGESPNEDGVLLVLIDKKPVRLAERARSNFLANASHELRTPLTSISGFIETMKGSAKDDMDSWPRFIDIMDEQTRHMRELIGDLLSLSRIELSGHLMPDTELDFGLLVEEAVEALSHAAAQRRVSIRIEKSDDRLRILGDAGEVKQVVGNLLSNAMKYARDDSTIDLSIGRSASFRLAKNDAARQWRGADRVSFRVPQNMRGASVWLRVRDNGVGIEQKHLARLGERFYRADGSRGGPIEGTGLGLAIVKHIMARHRGGFAVESVFGEGAAFSVWFAEKPAAD